MVAAHAWPQGRSARGAPGPLSVSPLEDPGEVGSDGACQPNGDSVAYLRVLRGFAFENALAGIAGTLDPAGRALACELVPVWEHLQAGPFAYGECPGLLEMDVVVGQRGGRDGGACRAPSGWEEPLGELSGLESLRHDPARPVHRLELGNDRGAVLAVLVLGDWRALPERPASSGWHAEVLLDRGPCRQGIRGRHPAVHMVGVH